VAVNPVEQFVNFEDSEGTFVFAYRRRSCLDVITKSVVTWNADKVIHNAGLKTQVQQALSSM
jgi:hypothetical protein